MNSSRKDRMAKAEEPAVPQSATRTAQPVILADPIGLVVERILSLGPGVKVRTHDEHWADVSFEDRSVEQVIRGLREISDAAREAISSDESGRVGHRSQKSGGGEMVDKLPANSRAAASLCIAGEGRLYVDAIPMALKASLASFVEDLCGVTAIKATLTSGICAEIRSSGSYIPNP